jgi:hypothetical protein
MPVYTVRQSAESYGHAIGVILLDTPEPSIPGDVRNASTYGYPVLYRLVPGLSVDAALNGDPDLEGPVVEAALALERQGVRAIASNCGFLLHYQDAVVEAVGVPVFMSSLLQLPLIAASIGPGRAIGVITADATRLGNSLMARPGVSAEATVHVRGIEQKPEFKSAFLEVRGEVDSDKLEHETVEAAQELVARHPETGAILFECAVLPPYARAVQDATGLPVFDFATMIDYAFAATHRHAYAGAY